MSSSRHEMILFFVDRLSGCLAIEWRGLMKQWYGAQQSGWSMRGGGPGD